MIKDIDIDDSQTNVNLLSTLNGTTLADFDVHHLLELFNHVINLITLVPALVFFINMVIWVQVLSFSKFILERIKDNDPFLNPFVALFADTFIVSPRKRRTRLYQWSL